MAVQVVCRIIGLAIVPFLAAAVSPPSGYPFNDVSLSWTERVDDLVSRLTLDEMTDQMAYGGRETHAPGIERLGIAPYPWGSECLRGDVSAGPATSFPQALGLAATFRRVFYALYSYLFHIMHAPCDVLLSRIGHVCCRIVSGVCVRQIE
jgi:hypothetical protein